MLTRNRIKTIVLIAALLALPGSWQVVSAGEPSMSADDTVQVAASPAAFTGVKAPALKLYVVPIDKILKMENVPDGTKIEIYSVLGARVMSDFVSNGEVRLPHLNKGIYIVRISKYSQKIVL